MVYKIFFSEIITSTVIQWLDPAQNLMKHVMAPRAATQEKMNLVFRGSEIFLAERYTVSTRFLLIKSFFFVLHRSFILFLNTYLEFDKNCVSCSVVLSSIPCSSFYGFGRTAHKLFLGSFQYHGERSIIEVILHVSQMGCHTYHNLIICPIANVETPA